MSIKISQLPPAEGFTDTDVIPLVQEGVTKKILVSKILELIPEDEPEVPPISDLPPADPLTGPELVAVMQEGEIRQTTVADFDVAFAHPYDIAAGFNGILAVNVTLMRYPFPRRVLFKAGFPSSIAVAQMPSSADSVMNIKKNGTNIGTLTFATGSSVATFSLAEDTIFEVGDVMTVISSATPDYTLGDIGIVFAGFRGRIS